LEEKDYFCKIRKHCGRGNIHLEHYQVSNYWTHQGGTRGKDLIFRQYDNFECKGLLTQNEYVNLVNYGIFLKNMKDKMGRPQLEEWHDDDGPHIRFIRANCLFKGKGIQGKYEGKGRRCKGCTKFLFKLEKRAKEMIGTDCIAQMALDATVNLQKVVLQNNSPIILKEKSDEEISRFKEEMTNLITSETNNYFRNTVERVLDQEEIMSNKQAGALVKIKMKYCI